MKSKTQFSMALHVMLVLAYRPHEWICSDVLAKSIGTHPVVIRRLLSRLHRAGLVDTRAGRVGGAKLAKQPHAITVLDIMNGSEDARIVKVHTLPDNSECPVSGRFNLVMDKILNHAQMAVERAFGSMTLQELGEEITS